jgi:hypothetical protein
MAPRATQRATGPSCVRGALGATSTTCTARYEIQHTKRNENKGLFQPRDVTKARAQIKAMLCLS